MSLHRDPSQLRLVWHFMYDQLISLWRNTYSRTTGCYTSSNLNLSAILSINFSFVLKPCLLIANCPNLTRTLSFAENIETDQDRFQETTDLLSHVLEMKPTKQQDDLVCKCVPQKLNLAPFIIRLWAKVLIMQHCATLPVPVSYCSKLRLDALIECVFLITRN